MPILAARPSERYLGDLARRVADLRLSYEEVGATAGPVLPQGYHHDRISTELGRGADTWGRGQEALRTWQAHRHAGATIYPVGAPIAVGTEVVATVRLGLLSSWLHAGSSMSPLNLTGPGLLMGPCQATPSAAKRPST